MYTEIPVLPVVVPLGILVAAALTWRLRHRDRLSAPRVAVAIALGVYAAGIVANTIFPIYRDKPTRDFGWNDGLVLAPWADYEVADAVMNIAVFLPLGVVLWMLMARATWWRASAAAALCSLAIEATQYVTARTLAGGHIADVHDLFFNVVGGGLGAALVAALNRMPALSPFVDRFRYSPAATGEGDASMSQKAGRA